MKLKVIRDGLEELVEKDKQYGVGEIKKIFDENKIAHDGYVRGVNDTLMVVSESYGLDYQEIKSEIEIEDLE